MKKSTFFLIGIFTISLLNLSPTTISAQTVQLVWSVSEHPDISHYGIYRSNHMDSSFTKISTVSHPDSTYLDPSIQLGSYYIYATTAVDLFGNESDFSNIVEVETSLPTPVELTSFSGHLVENKVVLEWSTATETNNYGFELLKSKDSVDFSRVAFIKGNGTTLNQQKYQFIDEGLTIGSHYYRLKQIDFDGTFEFSDVIEIAIGTPGEFRLFQNYPNPFNPATAISYNLPQSSQVDLTIYNNNGQEIHKLVDEYQNAGRYTVQWKGISSAGIKVASGIYYYKIQALNTVMFRKMMFLK